MKSLNKIFLIFRLVMMIVMGLAMCFAAWRGHIEYATLYGVLILLMRPSENE